jgi:hypothetical protein
MKHNFSLRNLSNAVLVFALGLLPACTNTTIVMHKTALDVNAEFTADLSKPVAFNAGYESKASVAVPPRNSQDPNSLRNWRILPEGDVLSTVSAVKVERIPSDDAVDGVAFDFVSVAATGKAADSATETAIQSGGAADVASAIGNNPKTVSPHSATSSNLP